MEKKIKEMTLDEALNCLEEEMEDRGYSVDGYTKRQALYEHILQLCELETGGEG